MHRNYRNEDNVVRMEKKASNKFGLFVLLVIVIVGAVFGGKYLYDHRDDFEWHISLPWSKLSEEKVINKDSGQTERSKRSSNGSLTTPQRMSDELMQVGEGYLQFKGVKATDQGYIFTLEAVARDADVVSFICEKVLIDGFDTSTTFEVVDYHDDAEQNQQTPTRITFQVNKSELDALGINKFDKITLFLKTKSNLKETAITQKTITAVNKETVKVDNTIKGLVKIDEKNSLLASYYETIEDKDSTYIYFDFKNKRFYGTQTVKIKKLLINGEIYDYKDFSADVYYGSEKVAYIEIPKSKVEDVKSFTVSFFYIDPSTGEETPSYYITNEYSKEF